MKALPVLGSTPSSTKRPWEEAYSIICGYGIQLDDPSFVERIAATFEGLGICWRERCADGPRRRRLGRGGGRVRREVETLLTPEQSQSVRFITDPTWRAYAITYTAGRELCRPTSPATPHVSTLLTEHVRSAICRVEIVRIRQRLDQIYAIAGSIARYSAEEDVAHELAAGWMTEAGLDVSRDEAGNLFGRRGDARKAASHLDSVLTGGRFDGALGVVAAIEAAERLFGGASGGRGLSAEETGPMGSKRLEELFGCVSRAPSSRAGACARGRAARRRDGDRRRRGRGPGLVRALRPCR